MLAARSLPSERDVIADLHAHYPMHLVPETRGSPFELMSRASGRQRLRDKLRALLVGFAGRFMNYRDLESGERVNVSLMRKGGVGVALSVAYSFFDEVDLDEPYGAPPEDEYIDTLLRQLDYVEQEVAGRHRSEAAVARNPAELEAALADGKVALVHCVEGGFHLGRTPEEVDRAVKRLAERGVAYVILAHLFWRHVATNAPALPFLSDRQYRFLFPQPGGGLSELGEAALRAMVREHVLIDLSHMSTRALTRTFELLDGELDPGAHVPVFASHTGFRFGSQEYALTEDTIRRIAKREGVVGLIFAQHQLLDGLPWKKTTSFDDSFEVLCRHIDRIAAITGSRHNIALGSDFDGFIKPTLGGLEDMADMGRLHEALLRRYGSADGEAIASGNALRLLRAYWKGAPAAVAQQSG
jgi:microsomal dipeptidase-like Zn-dependent dipeptidase